MNGRTAEGRRVLEEREENRVVGKVVKIVIKCAIFHPPNLKDFENLNMCANLIILIIMFAHIEVIENTNFFQY